MSSIEDTSSLETLLKKSLPEDFRKWLCSDEPHYPVPSDVVIPDDPEWIDEVANLYNASQILRSMRQEYELNSQGVRDLPRDAISIGDNDNGDYYLLSLRDSDFGSVYYMFHETFSPEEDDWNGLFLLAPDFASWLSSLSKKPHDPSIPDWEAIRKAEFDRIISTPAKPRWKFWKSIGALMRGHSQPIQGEQTDAGTGVLPVPDPLR